ncbi:MAG TPA: hypothetical protein VF168_10455 [Trueperaceae bacterium]
MSRYEYLLVKAALVYLVLTGLLGVAFLIEPTLAGFFRVTHVHLGVIGFFLSMVMGVAYWMMPRPGQLKQEGLEALTFYLLNAGLVLRIIAEPWWRYSGDPLPHWLSICSGLLLLAAIVTFAVAMQARVKTKEMILELRSRREATEQG